MLLDPGVLGDLGLMVCGDPGFGVWAQGLGVVRAVRVMRVMSYEGY